MAGIVVGFKCPFCGYDGGDVSRPSKMLEWHLFEGTPVAYDLECGDCFYRWREFQE